MNPALSEPSGEAANTRLDRFPEDDIHLAARVNVPVLITASNHDRRDIYARLIHATGESVGGPFVKFCRNGRPGAHVEGSEHLFRPPVRVIAGSSRHLGCDWAAGEFNEQLFYRLNVIHVVLMH